MKRFAAAIVLMLGCAVLGAQTVDICDRTPQIRDAILAATSTADDACESVSVSELQRISSLLNLSGISSLQADDFSGLTGMSFMSLLSNSFTSFPDGVFSDMTRLSTLQIGSRGLTELSSNVFLGLGNLQRLDVRNHMNLTGLPSDVFSRLTDLQVLNLQGNGLTSLSAGIFSGLHDLTEVYLSANPDAPFTLTVTAKFTPATLPNSFRKAGVRLVLREGAPRPITVGLSATGAELSTDSLTIPTGRVESDDRVTITRHATTFGLTLGEPVLGGDDSKYLGIEIASESPSTFVGVEPSGGVSLRLRMLLEGALE